MTALAGQVLTLTGQPLLNVTLRIGAIAAQTDATGRFLLAPIPSGHQEMWIDGRTAGTPGRTYGIFEAGTNLTLPNGIVVSYGYDAAGQPTAFTYQLGSTTLGDLSYTYDRAGNRTQLGGAWARTGLPQPLTSATYDAANQLTTWGNATPTHDANGNPVKPSKKVTLRGFIAPWEM